MSAPLRAGDRAWCLVHSAPTPSTRCTLEGAAQVEVIAAPQQAGVDTYRCRVLQGSGVLPGRVLELRRAELYACADPVEHLAFGLEVHRFWGPEAHHG